MWNPVFERVVSGDGGTGYRVGHELIDEFLEFVAGRARPNTVKAYAHDLKVFFTVVGKEPGEVTARDVMAFVTDQRRGRAGAENVVRITDASAGLAAATIKRRLAAVSALYGYLVVRGDAGVTANPVPHGLPTRQHRHRGPRWCRWCGGCGVCRESSSRPSPTGWWGAAHAAGSGHRAGDALGRAAALRGARLGPRGPAPGRVACLHH